MRAAAALTCLLLLAGPVTAGNELCLECHAGLAGGDGRHAVDAPAPATLAGRLPTEGGRITCLTCHRRHGLATPAGSAPGRFLLRAEPPELCALCHVDGNGRWSHPHATYADPLHGGTRLALPATSEAADPLSERCLGCHDGAQAPDAPHTLAATARLGRSHPIGVALVRTGPRARQYRPAAEAGALGIRLFGGRVGCGSCHRLYAHRAGYTAVPPERGRLCLACHAL